MWFKGVLTSEKLGTLIDSELLIYCLQADYILSCIRVCITKMLFVLRFTPLLLSTMDMTSTSLATLLYIVVTIAHLSVALWCIVDMTPQPSDTLLWSVYASPQSISDQLPSLQSGVNQLSLGFGDPCSKLHLLSVFRLSTPLVSVPVSMTRCSVASVTSCSGACLIIDLPWVLSLHVLALPHVCSLENKWMFPSCDVM
jgi:hypothetical protein